MTHYQVAAGQKSMTSVESADFLGVTRNAVLTFLKDGRLKGTKNDKDEWEIWISSLTQLRNSGKYRKFKKRDEKPNPVKQIQEVKSSSEVILDGEFVELRLKIKKDKYDLLRLALSRKDRNPTQWILDTIEKTYNDIVTALGMTDIG